MKLRDYQQECVDKIESMPPGAYLVQMATGLGKTVTFASIPRHGRTLLVSHREELVEQPRKYYTCSYGIERGKSRANGEDVVSTSVQTMSRRMRNFAPDEFDTIICDEAHHAAANTYRKIFEYFHPQKLIGFTATPNRSDSVRLDNVFQDIIFERDLRWGIQNGYLSDIYCRRVNIGYDLSGVHSRGGDYMPGELADAMAGTADAVAQAYREMAIGATLIFAVNVEQSHEIAKRIPGAVAVTGETKNRAAIIDAFTRREIPCLVNCMVFTEGTDMPLVETVIIARPTQSDSLYAQMVGRGLRLSPGKDKLNLIDCVGVSGARNLRTAPSLLGIDMRNVPECKVKDVQGLLFDLPDAVIRASDCPQSWIRNIEIVNLWAKEQEYNTHNVNYFRMPDGSMVCNLPGRKNIVIPCPDDLGRVKCRDGSYITMQRALDAAYQELERNHDDCRTIWDLDRAKRWGSQPATERQINIIKRSFPELAGEEFTKLQAGQILNRIFCGRKKAV